MKEQETEVMAEHVKLDGIFATDPWPLELARSLLRDPLPWGTWWPGHPEEHRPTRYADFNRLALQVTAYKRHRPGVSWGVSWSNPVRDEDLDQALERYSTQDLLDALFFATRGDRFNYGLICRLEPRLRLILQEVVRRVQSEEPPQFEVESSQKGGV